MADSSNTDGAGRKAHPEHARAGGSWESLEDHQMSADEAEPWRRNHRGADGFSVSDVELDYCAAFPAGTKPEPAPDYSSRLGAQSPRRSLERRTLSGMAPSFDLHDPLVQQFLLHDASVRRAAQAAIGYLRGKGSGKQSYSRSAARMVMRTASFSRDAVFSLSSKSALCKTLAREECARSTAFQAALQEHALQDYASCLTSLVQGLADISPATRPMRRSVFLSQYASMAEQHLSICVALMSSLGEPLADPLVFSTPRAARSPARGMGRKGSGGSQFPSFPELTQLDPPQGSREGSALPCTLDGACEAASGMALVPSPAAASSGAAQSAGEGAAWDGAAADEPAESPPAAPVASPAALGTSNQELSDMSPEENLKRSPSGGRLRVLFAEHLADVVLRGNTSTPPMRAAGASSPWSLLADDQLGVESKDADSSLAALPVETALKRASSMPSEEATIGASVAAQGGDSETSEVEFSLPAGSASPGRKGHYISEPPAFSFRVRGPQYLSNKAKVPCQWAALSLLGVDLRRAKQRQDHLAQDACAAKVAQLREVHGGRELLLINFQCPSKSGGSVSVVLWWVMSEQAAADPKFTALWRQMLDSDDDKWRGARLKLIPCVVEGNFIVRKLVGSRPVLIKAIKTKYYSGPGYLEVDADIVSSSMATNMWRGVESACRGLVVDLGFVIEASAGPQAQPPRPKSPLRSAGFSPPAV